MPMAPYELPVADKNVTTDEDNFAYHGRPAHNPPLIPAQWISVSVTDYHKLVERVKVLERRLEELEGD